MAEENIVEKFSEFLREFYYNELVNAVSEGKKSIIVDFNLLDKFDTELSDNLLDNPEEVLLSAEESIGQIDLPGEPKLKIRIFNLPESRGIRIRNVRAEHIGKLISIDGMVKRSSEIRPEVSEGIFECPDCGERIIIIQTERIMRSPLRCTNPSCRNSKGFKLVSQKLYDARWIVVEEPYEITSGERPSILTIYLKEDLTSPKMQNKTDPGNRIKVVGILKEMPRRIKGTRSRQMEIYLEANSIESIEVEWEEVEIAPDDEMKILELARDPEIYTKLVGSIAPALYGLEEIKEAVSLQLFGGEAHIQKDKSRVRGDVHILLVGDPSTAKSALMKVVSMLIPRSRYVSGKGVTGAGLTASVIRDEEFIGGWVLEAGALVMSNRSMIAIDEFEKVEKTDQIALHEAMELQSYHPSFEIFLGDGRKVKIGQFVDSWSEKTPSKKIRGINCEMLSCKDLDVKLLTTDFNKFYTINAKYVSRHKAPNKFIKIKFSNGREIIVTPEHPIYTFQENNIECIPVDKLKVGDFVPGVSSIEFGKIKKELKFKKNTREKDIIAPSLLDNNLSRFLGYLVTEGYSYSGSSKEVGISNTNPEIITDIRSSFRDTFGISPIDYTEQNRTQRLVSSALFRFLSENFPETMTKAKKKRIPSVIFTSDGECIRNFLESAFLGDGSIENNSRVCYRTSSKGLAEDYQDLLLLIGVFSTLVKDTSNDSYKVYISADSMRTFIDNIFNESLKQRLMVTIKTGSKKRYHNVVPYQLGLIVKGILKDVGISYTGYFNKHVEKKHGINKYVVDKYLRAIETKIKKIVQNIKNIEDLRELRCLINWSQQEVAEKLRVKRGTIDYAERNGYDKNKRNLIVKLLKDEIEKVINATEEKILELSKLKKLRWLTVEKIEIVPNSGIYKTDWVYDITVQPTNNFVSHGLILHNTISIAKANIIATLPAQTAILGGGNPKFGRFDPYLPIKEQLDLPETILSRFDLKFALRDIPNPETDAKVADHILKARHFGEEEVKPVIEPDVFKKYVAYARKNCHPKLSREAGAAIEDFFLKLRERVTTEEAPIPISWRQYEAMIRLAEASAKVQLRNEVTVEDAIRAINLMKASLRQFGFEPETGKLDIDRAEGYTTSMQRNKIRVVLDVIGELGKTFGKSIPQDEVINRARAQGVDNADEMIRKMLNEGVLFAPKPNFIQKI